MIQTVIIVFIALVIPTFAAYIVFVVYNNFNEGRRLSSGDNHYDLVENKARIRMLEAMIHEVGNCATSMLPLLQNIDLTLRKKNMLDNQVSEDLHLVTEQLYRLIETKQDASIFSQLIHDDSFYTNVNECIHYCHRLLRHDKRSTGMEIILELSSTLPMIRMTTSHLTSVMTNLLINALDAIAVNADKGKIVIETYLANDNIVIGVIDNGCGMSEAVQAKALQAYYTTKKAGKGTGLGLYVINKLVHESNGYMKIESQENEGTSISIYLPMVKHAGENQ